MFNPLKFAEFHNQSPLLTMRVQTTINHISILPFLCFLTQYQRQRKCVFFFSRARAEKGIARHIDASSVVWTLVIFDWFVLSMRMQVILDSLFARPGPAPIGGGKKGEFRDWTREFWAFTLLSSHFAYIISWVHTLKF